MPGRKREPTTREIAERILRRPTAPRPARRGYYSTSYPAPMARLFKRAAGDGWWTVEGGGLAMSLQVRLSPTATGEIVATAVVIGLDADPPAKISASALHDVPLQKIIAVAVDHLKLAAGSSDLSRLASYFSTDRTPKLARNPRVRPGPAGYTDDDLRQFAREWREAFKTTRGYTKLLAEGRGVGVEAIRHQRRQAEAGGFLKRPAQTRRRKSK